jgi:hypothetical protein
MKEAVSSSEPLISTRLHGATSEKTAIVILMTTSDLRNKIPFGKFKGKRLLGKYSHRLKDNIKMGFK